MYSPENFHPSVKSHPLHIGIIPDGGRRWAVQNACSLIDSYDFTRQKLYEFVPKLLQNGVNQISIYLSSKENFRRSEQEVKAFVDTSVAALLNDIRKLAYAEHLHVKVAGIREGLPQKYINAIELIENETIDFTSAKLNLCIGYHPHDEIIHAINAADSAAGFVNHLWVNTPIDLVIRTGGANLLSNFLPLQSGYARLYFFNELFNNLKWENILSILNEYKNENLKYGT
jgi:undecaprenyl diphosphate synthase